MSKKEYSAYQQNIITNYYQNLDSIMLQKLSELVSDLYLADSPKKAENLWKRVEAAMKQLKIPDAIVTHIMQKRSVEILAKNLQDWLSAKGKK